MIRTAPLILWIPGPIVNPGASGWTWLKRARLAKTIRERVAQHVLVAVGRRPPWPVEAPKLVTFTGYVHSRFDDDRFPLAIAPYRDGVMDCGMFSPRGAPGRGDGPEHGHQYRYAQVLSRGRVAVRGVEITITPLREDAHP